MMHLREKCFIQEEISFCMFWTTQEEIKFLSALVSSIVQCIHVIMHTVKPLVLV